MSRPVERSPFAETTLPTICPHPVIVGELALQSGESCARSSRQLYKRQFHHHVRDRSDIDRKLGVAIEPDTIEEAYEPFLIMEGYLERTPKGRMATAKANERLGLKPAARQGTLF